jgi:hypothetical protein
MFSKKIFDPAESLGVGCGGGDGDKTKTSEGLCHFKFENRQLRRNISMA